MSHRRKAQIQIHPVPSEAGTHFAGQADAPRAILEQGQLHEQLQALGYDVQVHTDSDLEPGGIHHEKATWKPSTKKEGIRNATNAEIVLNHLYNKYLTDLRADAGFRIFLGGDCSITLPIFSAFKQSFANQRVGLMYVDGDVDLTLPAQTAAEGSSGILDSMVLTHLTARPGSRSSFTMSADGRPLISPDNIVLFGFDPLEPQTEHFTYLLENRFHCFSRPSVAGDPQKTAREALEWLEGQCDVILLHFDVDVIDSGVFPLANYPHYAGLSLEDTMTAVQMFLESPKVQGLVLTEVNPSRDPSGAMIRDLTAGLVKGFQSRARRNPEGEWNALRG